MGDLRRALVRLGLLGTAAWLSGGVAGAATWRVGDAGQPWQLHPVSFLLDAGEVFKPEFVWGGSQAVEVVVDDDGDGLVDEDPVDILDNDGDGLYNEDPADGIDDDRDGAIDEDRPDDQFDNDGDGLLNEDGLRTGGIIFDDQLRAAFAQAPFFRRATPEEAAAEPTGPGWGWGDDDYDARANEDPLDGGDDDGDGLVDEDPASPGQALPQTWTVTTFAYAADALTPSQRLALAFHWDPLVSAYVADGPGGESVTARATARQSTPSDWLRPIRADGTRNLSRLAEDRFLSGIYGTEDPFAPSAWSWIQWTGTTHEGTAGYGQVVDGNIFTARVVSNRGIGSHFRVLFPGLFYLEGIRIRPRPDFPDRTPTGFDLLFAGDKETHFQQRYVLGELQTSLVVNDPVIPRQVDQARPPIKEYWFAEGGPFGPPPRVRVLNLLSNMPEGQTWEMAEFEAFGRGYALDGSYITEIIDVGAARPRFRRYFDPADAARPIPFEAIQTLDGNRDEKITADELASTALEAQFDPELAGRAVTWGRARWRGQVEGGEANVQVRVRSGTSLDTHIYQRRVGRGVQSPFIDRPIVADWPAAGSRIDLFSYAQLPGLERAPVKDLPANGLTDRDGLAGGWSPWTAPFDFQEGQVDRDGTGGVLLPLPPLHRYIQFRFDFVSDEASGVSLDYVEFEYASPVVSRGILAEIFPDTAAALGRPTPFRYVLKPDLDTGDLGFDRIDIAVPSAEARVDSLLVDDLRWEPAVPERERSRAWLDTLSLAGTRYGTATYYDTAAGTYKLGIKTRVLGVADFPRGQDREIEVALTTPVFRLLTGFDSWIWNEARAGELQQPTQPGDASDRLPSDALRVTVPGAQGTVSLRQVAPNPFTPNGDGSNDEAAWTFDVFLLTSATQMSVTIFGLDGRAVRKLEEPAGAGERSLRWDGRDESRRPVPPGIYLYRLFVDSDTEMSKEQLGTICVVY